MLKHATALLAAVTTLSFCSCQSLSSGTKVARTAEPSRLASSQVAAARPQPQPGRPIVTAGYYPGMTPQNASLDFVPAPGQPQPCPHCAPKGAFAFSDACELSDGGCANGQCAYPPYDEYLCDGGDNAPPVEVRRDWSVHGLDQEDTIVHFDTLKGDTELAVSNKVCLYAPRFGAVRQVTGMVVNDKADRLADANKALPLISEDIRTYVTDLNQPRQPIAGVNVKQAQSVLDRNKGLTAETTRGPVEVQFEFLPYEQLDVIRRGVLSNNDKPRLAQLALNAIVWVDKQSPQVVLDKKLPLESKLSSTPGETLMYDLAGKPRMRIIKIADQSEAQPGDTVSFTLRFDNVGDQKVGNVTIIDNLTTRLEYIPDSQECSHEATFLATENDGETSILRWEVKDPLQVGEGGIIRFKCRVR
jgi:uncharacterized repeat protein (TIGR01451 family)